MRTCGLLLLWFITATANAQVTIRPQGLLRIHVDRSGTAHLFQSRYTEPESPLGRALLEALGCSSEDVARARWSCKPIPTRRGLTATISFPLSRLNPALTADDVAITEIVVDHDFKGFSRLTGPIVRSTNSSFGWNHEFTSETGWLPDVTLEYGFEESALWLLLAGALVVMLAPLMLLTVRSDAVAFQAVVRMLTVLTTTAWLWILLDTNVPSLIAFNGLPGPPVVWMAVTIALPALIAVALATQIVKARAALFTTPERAAARAKLTTWGGVALSGLLVTVTAMTVGGEWILSLSLVGTAIFLGGLWKRYFAFKGTSANLSAGPLLERIQQLATNAGTRIATVQLFRTELDAPAAFAGQRLNILLSHALLGDLPRAEVDAIVAHELSHIKRGHAKLARLTMTMLPLFVAAGLILPELNRWTPLLIPPVFLMYMAIRRHQEFTADADATRWTGGPEAFVSGLAHASRANGLPFEASRWTTWVMPHPPTKERFKALGVSPARVDEIISRPPTEDRYDVPPALAAANGSQAVRNRLRLVLVLLALVFPPVYSVAVPQLAGETGWNPLLLAISECAAGVVAFYLLTEWLLWRARYGYRDKTGIASHGGAFVGISPTSIPAIFEGMYDFDWGFVTFAGEWLILRGDQGTFVAHRDEIGRLWLDPGPRSLTPKPMLSLELAGSGRGFSIRPFEGAFALAAPQAGARLFAEATRWKSAPSAPGPAPEGTPLQQYPQPTSQPDAPPSYMALAQELAKTTVFVAAGVSFCFNFRQNWSWELAITPMLVFWGIYAALAWPSLRFVFAAAQRKRVRTGMSAGEQTRHDR